MTDKQRRIIKVYDELSETRVVRPSYGLVAKKAKVSKATAYKTIQQYIADNAVFGLQK